MAIKTGVEIEGGANLLRQFKRLETSAKRKSLRAIFRRAGRPVITQARRNLQDNKRTGELQKNVAQTVRAETFASKVEVDIGPRRKQFYGRFLELGTAFIAPSPWLVPALVSTKAKVLGIISIGFMKEITRIVRTGGR